MSKVFRKADFDEMIDIFSHHSVSVQYYNGMGDDYRRDYSSSVSVPDDIRKEILSHLVSIRDNRYTIKQ